MVHLLTLKEYSKPALTAQYATLLDYKRLVTQNTPFCGI